MLSPELEELLEKWNVREKTFSRDIETQALQFVSNRHAVFLYGPRRAGKSTIAKRILQKMPKKSITRYVNLEDPKLANRLNTGLLDEFSKDLAADDTLVLDEIQLVLGWEKWVRKTVDTKKCRLIVTGSSSKLLSSEFATALGGRGVGFQVLPLSFREFRRVTKKGLEEYIKTGGYPEVALNPNQKEKLLESYFETALLKDIIARYNVRDVSALRNLAFFLLTNSGKETSLKKIRAALGLSYDTIRQFVDYLESSFLVFQVPFFSYSMAESLTKPRKIFAFDTGMQQYASKSFSEDFGKLAETAVAIELKNRGFDVYYWKEKKEVDFIAKQKTRVLPINISYAKTLPEREFESLDDFCTSHKISQAKILYLGKKAKKTVNKTTIELENIQTWLLKK